MSQQRIITIGEDVYNTRKTRTLVNEEYVCVWIFNDCYFTESELDAYKIAYNLSKFGGVDSPDIKIDKVCNNLWKTTDDIYGRGF